MWLNKHLYRFWSFYLFNYSYFWWTLYPVPHLYPIPHLYLIFIPSIFHLFKFIMTRFMSLNYTRFTHAPFLPDFHPSCTKFTYPIYKSPIHIAGGCGRVLVLDKFQSRGVLLIWKIKRARAYCASSRCGKVLFGHFFSSLSYLFSIKTEIFSQKAIK